MNKVCLLDIFDRDMNSVFYKNYILTTLRLMITKWWLSLVKIFSLTTGILSFLLIWLFYIDHEFLCNGRFAVLKSCSLENVLLLGFIIIVTMFIYFLVLQSQIPFRYKELFLKKYYGETSKGILKIWLVETIIFIIVSLVLSLVLIDQVAPFFNSVTNREVNIQHNAGQISFIILTGLLSLFGMLVGVLPSLFYIRKRAVDILKKLPHYSIK
ncbi:MAG: hypothetical protein MI975_18005 [Cytophagales bacterium]|nr:hypothetical protein [Cytophagales bacterium]